MFILHLEAKITFIYTNVELLFSPGETDLHKGMHSLVAMLLGGILLCYFSDLSGDNYLLMISEDIFG